jgi:hypothetical protein
MRVEVAVGGEDVELLRGRSLGLRTVSCCTCPIRGDARGVGLHHHRTAMAWCSQWCTAWQSRERRGRCQCRSC